MTQFKGSKKKIKEKNKEKKCYSLLQQSQWRSDSKEESLIEGNMTELHMEKSQYTQMVKIVELVVHELNIMRARLSDHIMRW